MASIFSNVFVMLFFFKNEIHQIVPQEGCTTYGYNYQNKITFRRNKQNAEHLKEAKIRGKIKLAGSATKATIDGYIIALFKQVSLQRTNSTPIDQVDSVNRLAISHKI